MHSGKIKASGSPLFLKSKYGDGYQISILNKKSSEQILEKWILQALPGSEIVSSSSGAITIGVGKSSTKDLSSFLRVLQNGSGMEWSVSNSTLEEVFLKLCSANDSVNAEIESRHICRICNHNPTENVTLYTASKLKVVVAGKLMH